MDEGIIIKITTKYCALYSLFQNTKSKYLMIKHKLQQRSLVSNIITFEEQPYSLNEEKKKNLLCITIVIFGKNLTVFTFP